MKNFLDYMINDGKGNINFEYINYINTINGLINNGSDEINKYNNYINNNKYKFPSFNELNKWHNLANVEQPNDIPRFFCTYLWMWIHH